MNLAYRFAMPLRALPRTFLRRPWTVVLLFLLLSVWGGWYSVHLYRNLRTDLQELLPQSARSVRDLKKVKETLESTENLAILVFSQHPEESKRFVTDLAERISRDLPDLVTHVEYKIDREIDFFQKRQALFIDLKDLRTIKNYVRDRKEYEAEIRNPLNIFSGKTLKEPHLDFNPFSGRYSRIAFNYARFKDGYYANKDQTIRVVLAYMKGGALEADQADKLRAGVDRVIASLDPKKYAPDIEIRFTSDVENLIEERASLISDVEFSTIAVAIIVSLAMVLFYQSLRGTIALVLSVFAGTLVCFGISYFLEGYLNSNSAFLGSIVIGDGINFGIIFLARYFEVRRSKHFPASHPEALGTALTTWKGTLTAALSGALAYGSLMATEFRGFRQFGAIGLIGMVCCWIAAYTFLPAMLTLFDRFAPMVPATRSKPQRHYFAEGAAFVVRKFPRALAVFVVGATILSLAVIAFNREPILETDTSALRDKRSMESGSGYLSKYVDEIFGRYLSPVVVLADTFEHASAISTSLKSKAKDRSTRIASVYSIDEFVPKNQLAKIAVLKDIRSMLPPNVRKLLTPTEKKKVAELLTPEAFHPFGYRDLPPLVQERFTKKDGTLGPLVLVEPVFNEVIMHQIENQRRFIGTVRGTADSIDPGAPVVGQLPLTVDLVDSIRRDGPRATLVALVVVMLLVFALIRKVVPSLETLTAQLLGVTWLSGLVLALHVKINFLNFIALPITFGIGVDYGVNVFQRYLAEGRGNIVRVIQGTGAAVALASFTTITGYSSLLMAGNQGFVSFGRIAVLGEITCLTGALWGLPAFLRVLENRERQRRAQQELKATPLAKAPPGPTEDIERRKKAG